MKYQVISRLFAIALAAAMLFGLAACGKTPQESQPPSESESGPSSEVPVENATQRPVLKDKIDAGIARNKDTVGWIQIPGTTIDDAVLQYTDNSYYLRLNEDKRYDVFGCYFMDYESRQGTAAELSRNNIIYGHSDLRDNKDGKKFSQLFKYTDIEFLRNNPYIFYSTGAEEMVWQVFAVFYTHVNLDYIHADPAAARFTELINEAKLRSEYLIDVPVTGSDKILTLSTCTVKYSPGDPDNYRFVIMAKLLPADRQLAPTVAVEKNPDPKKS